MEYQRIMMDLLTIPLTIEKIAQALGVELVELVNADDIFKE